MKDWQNGINIPYMFVAIFVICFIRLISCVWHFRIKNGTISIQFKTKDDSKKTHTQRFWVFIQIEAIKSWFVTFKIDLCVPIRHNLLEIDRIVY